MTEILNNSTATFDVFTALLNENLPFLEFKSVVIYTLHALLQFNVIRRFQNVNNIRDGEELRDCHIFFPLFQALVNFLLVNFGVEQEYFNMLRKRSAMHLVPVMSNVHCAILGLHGILMHFLCQPDRETVLDRFGGIEIFRVFYFWFCSFWFMNYGLIWPKIIGAMVLGYYN